MLHLFVCLFNCIVIIILNCNCIYTQLERIKWNKKNINFSRFFFHLSSTLVSFIFCLLKLFCNTNLQLSEERNQQNYYTNRKKQTKTATPEIEKITYLKCVLLLKLSCQLNNVLIASRNIGVHFVRLMSFNSNRKLIKTRHLFDST